MDWGNHDLDLRIPHLLVDHFDDEGNLYFGISLWKGDRHILVHLGEMHQWKLNFYLSLDCTYMARKISRTKPEDGSFALKEMSAEILENCIQEIRAKYP